MSAPTAKMVRLGDGASITVFMTVDGKGEQLTLRKSESEKAFEKAISALKTENWYALYEAMRPVKAVAKSIDGITVDKNGVFFNGEPINNVISTRIMEFANAGLDYAPLCAFLKKLMGNPSARAIKELYRFLEHSFLPISTNGNFLAYKGVSSDFYSITGGTAKLLQGKVKDGKIFNGIGEVIEMKRQDVDDDKDRTCSYGLHAGTMEYATGFARGKVLVVEINPADVVSIPSDCNGQKLRTCRYKVIEEFTGALDKPLYNSKWEEYKDSEDADVFEEADDFDSDIEFSVDYSSWISSVEWWDEGGRLVINKLDGGQIAYSNVPRSEAVDFETYVNLGGSAGEYFNEYIKGKFSVPN